MNKKEEAIKTVAELFSSYGIALSDITKVVPPTELIDLAVKSKGGIVRVSFRKPFEEKIGKNQGEDIFCEVTFDNYCKDVVGIYPIKDCDHWMASDEEYLRGDQVDHHQLPKERYFKRIHEILDAVNKVLRAVKAPVIEGYYLARPDNGDDGFLVVEMYENKSFKTHFVDQHTPAKCRYVQK